ncbi:ribonuclease H [Peptoclostridium acidaminophilum DSM 3953]|uniref:Ribonuclease H n=1 Tax=Peptoclostridium acidaminophilum DSM 3953 TaxID=1286171 RepID=W8T740_PEPAC|nr:ribonuclease HI family protein [Peptoclostridium acidaminophilum]AHM56675.1 ribonuclease H [Peptoclostridium acidaminophilum DSM 3953]
MKYSVYTDGGSRNNPGEAGIGVVVFNECGDIVKEVGEYIGIATNNVAEYKGLIRGLEEILSLGCASAEFFLDSELVVKQIKGEYKVKNEDLKKLYDTAVELIGRVEGFSISHVKRNLNKKADALVNMAIDNK